MGAATAVQDAAMVRPTDTTQITARVPTEWLAYFDAVAAKLSRPGLSLSRTDAVRLAVARGLEELRAELGIEAAPPGAAGPPKAVPASAMRDVAKLMPAPMPKRPKR